MMPLFISVLLAAMCLECRAQKENVLQPKGDVTATEGEAVTLDCGYNSSSTGPSLYWYKQDGNHSPKFILSRFKLDEGNTADDHKERFSSTLNSTVRSVPLKIQKLQVSDSAVYYCAGAYSVNGTDYSYDFNLSESDAPPTTYLPEGFTYLPSQVCPQRLPSMKGRLEVNMSEVSLEEVERSLLDVKPSMVLGGYWKPEDCLPRWKVAILVPFRNRHEHLPILLRHLVPVLQKQRLQFAFYVIEQEGTEPFNRAMLFNVGYKEAMKDLDWDCLVFHDVDHLMENDRNYYGCTDMPRHFAVKLDKYSYMLPYNEFFGGVSGLTVKQFKKINGFPNAFWGWGGEDDDLWNRVRYANFSVSRPHGEQGRYMSIPHHHRGEVQFLGRYSLLRHSKERQKVDGLNNLNYSPIVSRRPLYTNITVSLSRKLAPIADY